MFMFGIELASMTVECDWCDKRATGLIYSSLAVQHACEYHLADWLIGQATALTDDEIVTLIVVGE